MKSDSGANLLAEDCDDDCDESDLLAEDCDDESEEDSTLSIDCFTLM